MQAAPLLSREVLRLTDLLAAVEALVTDPKRAVSPYRCPLDLRTFAPGTRDFGPQWVAWDRGRDDGADYLATRVRMAMEGNPYA